MSESRSRRIRRIFDEALDVEAAERRRFVERACGDDAELLREVLALLGARDESGDFLESGPPAAVLEQALPTRTPAPGAGTVIGDYRLTDEIARGGMGIVYRAEQENPKRVVALKLMRPGILNPDLQKRFEVETRVLGRLQHPGIAQIYAAGTADVGGGSQPYFAMELVDGLPLVEYAKRHDLDVGARLELMIDVCEAVQHAHQKGVIHRDLKPANILVDASGQPKVLDFGIARSTEADTRQATAVTTEGELLGTLAYMSPEQVTGRADEIDTRADVYALGVVLFELLSGTLPYELDGKPLTEAIRVVGEGRPRPLPAGRGIDDDLRVIVATALEPDRDRRFASPSELAADLKRYLRQEPIEARPASTLYRFRKLLARHRLASTFAGALVVALIVSGILLMLQNRRIRAAMEQAQEEALTASEVSAFLEGLFKIADPSEAKGNQVTARELLDRGAERIETELQDQPKVQRRLMRTMGEAYTALGLPAEAIPLLERAVKATGPGSERVVLLARLAWAQRSAGNADAALEISRQAADEAASVAEGEGDEPLAVGLTMVGIMLRDQGEYPRARAALQETLRIREQLLGPDHLDVGLSRYHLAWTLHLSGDSEAARQEYELACPIFERELGIDHASTAWCYDDHGIVLTELKENEEAERLLGKAYEIRQRILPADHPDLIASARKIAVLYWQAGDLVRCREKFAEVFERSRDRLGDSRETHEAVTQLALAEERLGSFAEAESHLREALALGERLAGTDTTARIRSLADLGFFLMRRERQGEGEAYVRQALQLIVETTGPTSSRYASYLYQLATGLASDPGRLEEAREMLTEYLAIREQEAQPSERQIGRAKTHRGRLAILSGDVEQGCEDLDAAVSLLEAALGDHLYVAEALFWLATCRQDPDLYDRSLALWASLRDEGDNDYRFARACRLAHAGEDEEALAILRALAEDGFEHRTAHLYPHFEGLGSGLIRDLFATRDPKVTDET